MCLSVFPSVYVGNRDRHSVRVSQIGPREGVGREYMLQTSDLRRIYRLFTIGPPQSGALTIAQSPCLSRIKKKISPNFCRIHSMIHWKVEISPNFCRMIHSFNDPLKGVSHSASSWIVDMRHRHIAYHLII